MNAATLKRQTFTVSREHEYFSESELVTQTGHPREDWFPGAIVKELVDNALDACEQAGIPPEIRITIDGGSLTVADNGPGIPADVVTRILDFQTRTSDKAAYVGPTRGAQGNATKAVLGMAYVLNDGEPTTVEIEACRVKHTITISMDQIARRPNITHDTQSGKAQGTVVRLDAGSQEANGASLADLIQDYALFNPHARFLLDVDGDRHEWLATNRNWMKWLPSDPTSAHWYTVEQLENLIASYIDADQRTGSAPKTVREFISEFKGLSRTASQKTVSAKARLERAYLHDLVQDRQLNRNKITRLLKAMQAESTPVKPDALGPLGEAHFKSRLVQIHTPGEASLQDSDDGEAIGQIALEALGVKNEDYRRTWGYRRFSEIQGGLPIVVEVGFCMTQDPSMQGLHLGLNWSPVSANALEKDDFDGSEGFQAFLAENYIDVGTDDIALVVHLICPRFDFLDRGKSTVSLSDFSELIVKAVRETTKQWTKIKKYEDRGNRQAAAQAKHRLIHGRSRMSIKDAAYEGMAEAYEGAAGSRGLAQSRQVYYAARQKILELTGETSLSGPYFQKLLNEYQREFPEDTADWDVYYDARGHFAEPHTGHEFGLGTLGVREYLDQDAVANLKIDLPNISSRFPTHGPQNRYGAVLFIEKEGFLPLLEQAKIQERYDIAVMSSKGMGSTAARDLVGKLDQQGVKILVAHDFDDAGFSIVGTLTRDTERYQHETEVEVIDVGLRLQDVEKWELQSERVNFKGTAETLEANGATPEEIEFLMGDERVELNAFTNDNFIAWLESKFAEHGVKKVIPDQKTLELAYRRAAAIARYRTMLEDAQTEVEKYAAGLKVPTGLGKSIRQDLKDDPELAWDDAVQVELVKEGSAKK